MRYEPVNSATTVRLDHRLFDWLFISETGSCSRSAVVAIGGGIWYRRRATLDVVAITVGDRARRSTAGRGCATSSARRRRGTCGCCRSGTSCSSCSRRWASRSSCAARRPAAWRGWSAGSDRRDRIARVGATRRHPSRTTTARPIGRRPRRAGRAWWHVAQLRAGDRDRGARGRGDDGHARARPADPRLPARTGRSRTTPATRAAPPQDFTAKSWPEYRAFLDTANSLAARSHGVGGRRRDRRVRHAARAHAAAVLDPRPDPVDGGPLLRGVGDDAVPLHDDRGHARADAVEPGARAPVPLDRRLRPRRAVPAAAGRALLRRVHRRGEGGGGAEPVAAPGRDRARPRRQAAERVDDLPGRRLADGRSRSPYEPVVVDDLQRRRRSGSAKGEPRAGRRTPRRRAEFSPWECTAVPWFNDPAALDRPLAAAARRRGHAPTRSRRRARAEAPLPAARSRTSRPTSRRSSFDVSRTGVPVMVKTSYYPNWRPRAPTGRGGPRRTSWWSCPPAKHVALTFGTTTAEWVGPGADPSSGSWSASAASVWWGLGRPAHRTIPVSDAAAAAGTISVPLHRR